MKRILFVDDQIDVLDGLRRLLREFRSEWEMEFVGSGNEALARMEAQPSDVVVSDLQMPGMTGTQLLRRVMQRYPGTVRIVLFSAFASRSVGSPSNARRSSDYGTDSAVLPARRQRAR